jgi:hypothetical protein
MFFVKVQIKIMILIAFLILVKIAKLYIFQKKNLLKAFYSEFNFEKQFENSYKNIL